MPAFNSQVISNSPLNCVYPGDSFTLFNAEIPATNTSSIAVGISEKEGRSLSTLSFEFIFAAVPGAFNYQIQGSDIPQDDASYSTEGSGTVIASTLRSDGTFRTRVELAPWVAKFCRIFVGAANANGVALTVRVTAQ